MTMHILGPQYNTANTRKSKPKMTKGNIQRWTQEMHQYNKRMRQAGGQRLSLDEYIDYVHGKGLPKKRAEFKELKATTPPTYRSTAAIPSLDPVQSKPENTALPTRKEYTGTLVKGIATMHKSNAVPVIDQEQMKDISRMRR